jgi:hypothetical protein
MLADYALNLLRVPVAANDRSGINVLPRWFGRTLDAIQTGGPLLDIFRVLQVSQFIL